MSQYPSSMPKIFIDAVKRATKISKDELREMLKKEGLYKYVKRFGKHEGDLYQWQAVLEFENKVWISIIPYLNGADIFTYYAVNQIPIGPDTVITEKNKYDIGISEKDQEMYTEIWNLEGLKKRLWALKKTR